MAAGWDVVAPGVQCVQETAPRRRKERPRQMTSRWSVPGPQTQRAGPASELSPGAVLKLLAVPLSRSTWELETTGPLATVRPSSLP